MNTNERSHLEPVCPSCGQPVPAGFFHFSKKVKTVLVVLLLGYIVLSIFILLLSVPAKSRKGCTRNDARLLVPFVTPNPERCQETEFDIQMKPFFSHPVTQVFAGSGVVIGVLVFFIDWADSLIKNWRRKREKSLQENGNFYRHKCRHCGRQWN